jgi:hypothetical protein
MGNGEELADDGSQGQDVEQEMLGCYDFHRFLDMVSSVIVPRTDS